MLKLRDDVNKRGLIYLFLLIIGIFSFYYFLYDFSNESLIIGMEDFFILPGVYKAGGLETITALASFTPQSSTVYVSSCGTLGTSNTEYILQNDITPDPNNISQTYCFPITGSNVTFDMNGKTVRSIAPINGAYKIGVSISGNNVTVKNGKIQNFYWGLYPNQAVNSKAENMNIYKNYNGIIAVSSTNFSISNSTLDSNMDYLFYSESTVSIYNSTIKRTMYLFFANQNVSFYNNIFEDNLFFNHSDGYPYNGPVDGSRGQEIDFSVRLNNFSEISSYSISTYPSSSSVTQSRSGQIVSGSFTPDKKGMYTLNVSTVDSRGNVYGSSHAIFIEPTRKTLKYYLRSLYSTNGQPAALNPAGDSGSLHFEQPTSEEYRDCGAWVQLSIEDLPPSILNAMTDLEFNIYYRGTTETYFGMKRYTDFSIIKDTQIQLPNSTSVTLGRGNLSLNWSSDYAWNNWNWYFSTLKIESYPIYMSTKPANLSWINLTYVEPDTFIRNLSDNSKILSIETYDNSNSSNISLLGDGEVILDIYTPAFQPEVYFDGQKCSLSSDCDLLASSNGNISLSLNAEGIHQVYVSENISVLSDQNVSFYNLQSNIPSGQGFNSSKVYGFNVSINSSVSLSNVFLSFGGRNYSASLNNGNYNVTLSNLGAGNYSYYWIANNTNGQINISQEYNYSISKASFVPTFLLNSSNSNLSLIYGSFLNISVSFNNGQDFNLYRNGLDVKSQNNLYQLLGVGYYNITVISSENQNYTSSSLVRFVNISRAATSLNLSGNNNITYGVAANITGTNCPSQLTCNLYRNGALVVNPENSILSAGSYSYIYNTSGNANYTSDSELFSLTVNQATSEIRTYLNNSRSNINIIRGNSINLNSTLIIGSGYIQLYRNNTLINQGSSPLVNLTLFNSTGYYNITGYYSGNTNYTSDSESWFVNVTDIPDTQSPQVNGLIESPADPNNYSSNQIYRFNSTWTDDSGISLVKIDFNGVNYTVIRGAGSATSGEYNFTIRNLGAGNYSYYWWANDTFGQVNQTSILTYTITQATGSINGLVNGTSSNINLTYGGQINVSSTSSNGQTVQILRNGIDVTSQNNQFISLAAGYYNYTFYALSNQNYTSSSLVRFVNISRATSTCSIIGSNVTYPFILNISGSCTNSEASANLYRNNSLVSNPYNALTGAGSYIFKVNVSQTQNYSSASSQINILVNQNNSYSLNLTLNPTTNLIYGNRTNLSGMGCPSGVSCNLYRNNLLVSNPDSSILAAGNYNYSYNFSGNQNYSSKSVNLSITINKASGQTASLINGQASDISVLKGEIVNLSAYLINGVGNVALYLDSSIINSGISFVSNLTNFSSVGSYQIKAIYSGNSNYTSHESFVTLGVYENEIVLPPNIIIISPTSIEYNSTTIDLNISADLPSNCTYSVGSDINLSLISNSSYTGFYESKSFNSNGNYSLTFTCTSQSGISSNKGVNFSINYQSPSINDDSPGEGTSSSGGGGGGGGSGGASSFNASQSSSSTDKKNISLTNNSDSIGKDVDEDFAFSNESGNEIGLLKKGSIYRKTLVLAVILFSMTSFVLFVLWIIHILHKKFILSQKT